MTTRTASPKCQATEVRSERYRIRFDSADQAELCAQTAGACRLVWNILLAYNDWAYRNARMARQFGTWTDFPESQRPCLENPGTTFQSMFLRFTDLRNQPRLVPSLPGFPRRGAVCRQGSLVAEGPAL